MMEPISDAVRRYLSRLRKRKRFTRLQEALARLLADAGVPIEVRAVRRDTLYVCVSSQSERAVVEGFWRVQILDTASRVLGRPFMKMRVSVRE